MLQRPPSSRPSAAERRHARKARYRQLVKQGRMCVTIQIGPERVDMLIRYRWLEPRETYDQCEIAEAVRRLLEDAARDS